MPLVFQDFVRNFYSIEQNDYEVTPLKMRWDAKTQNDDELRLLPTMTTDVHLKNDKRRIIIDTKYYKEALQEHYGKRSVNSENLYQLFSYVKNSEALSSAYANSEGILLYPAVGEKIDFRAIFQGHSIRVVTINLDQPWHKIRTDLLSFLQSGQPKNKTNGLQRTQRRNPRQRRADAARVGSAAGRAGDRAPLQCTAFGQRLFMVLAEDCSRAHIKALIG